MQNKYVKKMLVLVMLGVLLITSCKANYSANLDNTTTNKDKEVKQEKKDIIEPKKVVNIKKISEDKKYTFSYSSENRFVSLKIPENEWTNFINCRYNKIMPKQNNKMGMTISTKWCKFLYQNIKDDYDFIVYVVNEEERPKKLFMNGCYQAVKNDIKGIGTMVTRTPFFDYTKHYSKDANRLQGLIFLTHNDVIYNGPILHEILHRWGNYLIDCDYGVHWGNANIYGRLGGQKSIQQVGNNSKVIGYRRYWQGGYAPLELYLMGLIPKEEVPNITIAQYYSNRIISQTEWNRVDGQDIVVKGKIKTKTYTIQDIIDGKASNKEQALNIGDRVPNYKDSQKKFNMLFVAIDHDDINENQKKSINNQIKLLSQNENYDDGIYNFFEACLGKAELSTEIHIKE
ncbi:hypothetical protein PV797_20525 [Clostridiaceae bacterium M8S5]|nr:hypothetical protein PV797_20525 [Clostridiaceae bacterium M8S5]